MSKRKEAEEFWLNLINELDPGNPNVEYYKEQFARMTDKEMDALVNSNHNLPYYAPNFVAKDVDLARALEVGKRILGIEFFQHLQLTDPETGVEYITPERYLILMTTVRRQSQHVSKGLTVSDNSTFTDTLTGQAAGPSKTTQFTYPEIIKIDSDGLPEMLKELVNVRGGNVEGYQLFKQRLERDGEISLSEIDTLGTRPKAVDVLKDLLLGMHLNSNL
jgi:hypothetical protein